jgi:hypothetical protein
MPFAAVNNNTDNKKEEAGQRKTQHEVGIFRTIVLVVNSLTSHQCDLSETSETKYRTSHFDSRNDQRSRNHEGR